MKEMHREKKVFRTVDNQKIPLISFRYSKESINEKKHGRYNRIFRAEIYVHLQGECAFLIGDHTKKLRYGDILVYNKKEIHLFAAEPTTWERFVLFFYPEYFDFFENIDENLLNFYYDRNDYEYNIISLPENKRNEMINLLFEIDQYEGKNKFENDLHLFTRFMRVLQLINDEYTRPSATKKVAKYPDMVNETLNYININYSQNITLETISEHIRISKSYLSAIFKKHIGISPYEYLLNTRLENAKRQLAYGESITHVCYSCGFNDYSHFIQFFKKRTGLTPHQYCKQILNEQEE